VARRGASRGTKKGTPVFLWLFTGILIGLGLAWYLFAKGIISQPQSTALTTPDIESQRNDEPLLPETGSADDDKRSKPRYDFFTVLPEMEVVVPEQELPDSRQPTSASAAASDGDTYLLQAGSFKSASDADQMKAKLALMGIVANVQTVTVNDATWHRVRVGPVTGAREADEIRRQLQSGGIDTLVMKNP